MCLYPRLIKNRKYTANKKNGGNVPEIKDDRAKYVPIGCQECIECKKQKAREWQVRLLEDIKENRNGIFVTLTFSNESYKKLDSEIDMPPYKPMIGYDRDNAIATLAMRYFNERWRKRYGTALRHWIVTEIGHQGTENIHLHGIVWTDRDPKRIGEIWQYGFVWDGDTKNGKKINYVNERTIGYITKYVHKIDEHHRKYKSIVLTSPGVGGNYTKGTDWKRNIYDGTDTKETYRTRTGHKISLPIYWRNKIYDDEQREKLWLQRLDKEERWVRGEKIDVSKGYENYNKILNWHQRMNKELGYGDGEKKWEEEIYERERRMIKQKERIQKANTSETQKGTPSARS